MSDDEIDTSDIPPLTDEFFKRAQVREPLTGPFRIRVDATIPIDANVLAWFKAQGDDWEQRIDAALREYVKTHAGTEDDRS